MPKILVCTDLIRYPGGTTPLFPAALASIFQLQWDGKVDHLLQNGGDTPNQPLANCTLKRQVARETALRGDYDALLFADHDMLLPPDALRRLWAANASIAYGLYVLRHARDGYRWSAAAQVDATRWRSVSEDTEQARAVWGQCAPVAGMGFGCTLIRRDVLEALPMRWYDHAGPDWALAVDALAHGFAQVCDYGVLCGHMDSEQTFLPDLAQPGLFRVE